jgi:hypothetical protein
LLEAELLKDIGIEGTNATVVPPSSENNFSSSIESLPLQESSRGYSREELELFYERTERFHMRMREIEQVRQEEKYRRASYTGGELSPRYEVPLFDTDEG